MIHSDGRLELEVPDYYTMAGMFIYVFSGLTGKDRVPVSEECV